MATGEEVASQATLSNRWEGPVPEPKNKLKATMTVDSLSKQGVVFATELPRTARANS